MGAGLIFDLDGVLTDTVEFHFRSWRLLARDLGFDFSREENENLRGRSREEALELLLAGKADAISRQELFELANRQELLERKNRYFLQGIDDLGPDDLNPGVGTLLREARRRKVCVGLASSSRNARLVCSRLGILDDFDAFADGCSGLRPKPAPDLFVWVAGRLGLPPEACTVIEDAAAGVTAALEGGFRVVGVGDPDLVGDAHLVLPDLADASLDELLGTALEAAQ